MTLRPAEAGDLDVLHALWTDPDVRYLWDGEAISREQAKGTLSAGMESFDESGFGLWSVFPREGGALAGFCGLRRFGEEGEVEILFGIRPDLWGRGFATEAARAILAHAFHENRFARIFAGADPGNRASIRVIEKLGMRPDRAHETAAGTTPYWSIRREELVPDPGSRQSLIREGRTAV